MFEVLNSAYMSVDKVGKAELGWMLEAGKVQKHLLYREGEYYVIHRVGGWTWAHITLFLQVNAQVRGKDLSIITITSTHLQLLGILHESMIHSGKWLRPFNEEELTLMLGNNHVSPYNCFIPQLGWSSTGSIKGIVGGLVMVCLFIVARKCNKILHGHKLNFPSGWDDWPG